MNLESLKTYSLDQAQYFYRHGVIDQETFDAYCHLWQTSAPRFAVQACRCSECMKRPIEPNIEIPFGREKDLIRKP